MDIGQAILLGIVQGLTEFLPVSSSGHLVLAQYLLGVQVPGIAFEVATHLGTLAAVVLVFRQDLLGLARSILAAIKDPGRMRRSYNQDENIRLLFYLFMATLPAVVFGLGFKTFLQSTFENPREAAIELMITGVVLFFTLWRSHGNRPLTAGNTLLMGFAQAVAILPGISRSGFTIAAGLFCGVRGEQAARFSFLLSIPAILGAALIEGKDLLETGIDPALILPLVIGTLVSFLFGWLAIAAMLRILRRGKLYWFAPYCIAAGLIGLIFI